jgi:septal ring factor EnvC (AmiA/AmiB activator)
MEMEIIEVVEIKKSDLSFIEEQVSLMAKRIDELQREKSKLEMDYKLQVNINYQLEKDIKEIRQENNKLTDLYERRKSPVDLSNLKEKLKSFTDIKNNNVLEIEA